MFTSWPCIDRVPNQDLPQKPFFFVIQIQPVQFHIFSPTYSVLSFPGYFFYLKVKVSLFILVNVTLNGCCLYTVLWWMGKPSCLYPGFTSPPLSSAPAAPFIWEIKETSDHSQGIRDTKIYTLCLKKKSRKKHLKIGSNLEEKRRKNFSLI